MIDFSLSLFLAIMILILTIILAIGLDAQLNKPPVKNIKTYKGLPFIGTLLEHHPRLNAKYDRFALVKPNFTKFYQWYSSKNNSCKIPGYPEHPIFQFRIGKTWIVVINNTGLYREIFIKNSKKIDDRPRGKSFHEILSTNNDAHEVFTIGTSPKNVDYDLKKDFFVKEFFNTYNLENYYQKIIKYECDIFKEQVVNQTIDPLSLLQKYVSRIACWITFGIDLNEALDKQYSDIGIIKEISFVEREIVKLRNPIVNTIDHMPKYIQWLFFNDKINLITKIKERREKYIGLLYLLSEKAYKTKHLISNKKVTSFEKMAFDNCLITKFLDIKLNKGTKEELPKNNLAKDHILSICLTMMSAGLDNVSLLMNHLLHQLGQPTKQIENFQELALQEIFQANNNWAYNNSKYFSDSCNADDMYNPTGCLYSTRDSFGKCKLIKSVMNESIRYLSVSPLGLPRFTTQNIILSSNIQIPEKTIVISNLFLLNHNETTFEKAISFNPFRFEKGSFSNYTNFLKFREMYETKFFTAKTLDHNLLSECIQETVSVETEISCMDYSKPFPNQHLDSVKMAVSKNSVKPKININEEVLASGRQQSLNLKKDEYAKKASLINGFGKGARSCLGKKLAEFEMYFLILTIIKNFHVQTVSKKSEPLVSSDRAFYEEMDPRINNSSYDSIAIEQNWNSYIYFEKRSTIYKRTCFQPTVPQIEIRNQIYDVGSKAIKDNVTSQVKQKMGKKCLTCEIDEYTYNNTVTRSKPLQILNKKNLINIEQ